MDRIERTDWHHLAQDQVLGLLDADSGGLAEAEVQRRLETYGPNRLPEPPRRNALVRFLLHFHNILIYVLLGAAVITALLHHMVDTLVILSKLGWAIGKYFGVIVDDMVHEEDPVG